MECDCTASGFLVGGVARVQVAGGGRECVGTWLWLLIYQEGLGDSRQATPCVLTGTWAGFLRPQGKVPGDCFPESNLRTGEEGGRMRPLPASQTPWGEVVVSLLFT